MFSNNNKNIFYILNAISEKKRLKIVNFRPKRQNPAFLTETITVVIFYMAYFNFEKDMLSKYT